MYDVIVIGAGPAGISTSLYTQRAGNKTLNIYQEDTSLKIAHKIENYYGFEDGISGEDLYKNGIKQAKNIGVDVVLEEVLKIEFVKEGFCLTTNKNIYISKVLVIATGIKKNKSNIKGVRNFEGKGISFCAICDGFFYKGKKVAVIGSGNYAVSEANELLNVVDKVTILTNGEQEPKTFEKNIEILTKPIQEVAGESKVDKVIFKDGSKLDIDGIFIAQGTAGSTDLAKKLGIVTKADKIIVNENMQTNVPGIYACGDCVGGLFQISKAVHEGTIAAMDINKYLRKIKVK